MISFVLSMHLHFEAFRNSVFDLHHNKKKTLYLVIRNSLCRICYINWSNYATSFHIQIERALFKANALLCEFVCTFTLPAEQLLLLLLLWHLPHFVAHTFTFVLIASAAQSINHHAVAQCQLASITNGHRIRHRIRIGIRTQLRPVCWFIAFLRSRPRAQQDWKVSET